MKYSVSELKRGGQVVASALSDQGLRQFVDACHDQDAYRIDLEPDLSDFPQNIRDMMADVSAYRALINEPTTAPSDRSDMIAHVDGDLLPKVWDAMRAIRAAEADKINVALNGSGSKPQSVKAGFSFVVGLRGLGEKQVRGTAPVMAILVTAHEHKDLKSRAEIARAKAEAAKAGKTATITRKPDGTEKRMEPTTAPAPAPTTAPAKS